MKQSIKKYSIHILLLAVLLTPLVIIFFCWEPQDQNYKITGLSLSPIEILDSSEQHKHYFILHFTVQYCNPSYGFLVGGTEPGLNGSIEKLFSFRVFDMYNKDITKEIKGWHTSIPNIYIDSKGDEHDYYSHDNLDSLVNDINANVRSVRGCQILTNRIFYFEDTIATPFFIQMKLENYSITEQFSSFTSEKKNTLRIRNRIEN